MNITDPYKMPDTYEEAFAKNIIIVVFALVINSINGTILFTLLKNSVFHSEPRYILYINLVISDILMICVSVTLYVLTYAWPNIYVFVCCFLLTLGSTTNTNSPLNLACMAIERYIAICKPLHHSRICTVNRTYILISLIWGIAVLPAILDVIIIGVLQPISFFYSFASCQITVIYNTKYTAQKVIIFQCIYMSTVWLIIIYTYFRVLFVAKLASLSSHKSLATKARNTILLHGGQVLLCMLPYLTSLFYLLIPFFPAYRTMINFLSYLITNIIPRFLSALVYGVRDPKIVKHINSYFICKIVRVDVPSAQMS